MKKSLRISNGRRFLALARRAWHPVVRKGPWYWLRFAILLAVGSYLGHLLSEAPQLSDLRYASYQKQIRLEHRGQVYPQHTVLVLINDDDYWSDAYQARSPYKRNLLATLLNKLDNAGANTVTFDVDFSSPFASRPAYDFPDYAPEDALFFAAVRRMCDNGGHVVLSDGLTGGEQPPYHRVPTIYDAQRATLPCVSVGHDGLPSDMRKIAGMVRLDSGKSMNSLSLAIVKVTDPIAYERSVSSEDKGFRFGNYLTTEDFSPKQGRPQRTAQALSLAARLLPFLFFSSPDRSNNWSINEYVNFLFDSSRHRSTY